MKIPDKIMVVVLRSIEEKNHSRLKKATPKVRHTNIIAAIKADSFLVYIDLLDEDVLFIVLYFLACGIRKTADVNIISCYNQI